MVSTRRSLLRRLVLGIMFRTAAAIFPVGPVFLQALRLIIRRINAYETAIRLCRDCVRNRYPYREALLQDQM